MAFKLQLDESLIMAHVPRINMPYLKIFYLKLRPPLHQLETQTWIPRLMLNLHKNFKIKEFIWCLKKVFQTWGNTYAHILFIKMKLFKYHYILACLVSILHILITVKSKMKKVLNWAGDLISLNVLRRGFYKNMEPSLILQIHEETSKGLKWKA